MIIQSLVVIYQLQQAAELFIPPAAEFSRRSIADFLLQAFRQRFFGLRRQSGPGGQTMDLIFLKENDNIFLDILHRSM